MKKCLFFQSLFLLKAFTKIVRPLFASAIGCLILKNLNNHIGMILFLLPKQRKFFFWFWAEISPDYAVSPVKWPSGFGSSCAEKQNREPLKQPSFSLTHSCLEIYLKNVVWTFNTSVNNFTFKYKLEKIFEESCLLASDSHFSFKCFLKIAFVRGISPK